MKIEKGNATVPCTAQISRADIIAKFKLPDDARLTIVDGDVTPIDDESVIVAEYNETRKPRAKREAK
jgi:hypothetical protein